MIATTYTLRLARVTSEFTEDGYEFYGSHGIERTIAAKMIIPEGNDDFPIERIIKELGDKIIERLEKKA